MNINIDDIVNDDDVVIVVRPEKNADGTWDGNVTIKLAMFTPEDSKLTKKEQGQMLGISSMVAAALPVMNTDDEVYYALSEYVMEHMPDLLDDYIDVEEEETTHVTKDGNVYTLSFNSKTEGNA